MNRRTLLISLGAGAVAVAAGGFYFVGRGGPVRGGLPEKAAPGLDLIGTRILYYASLAPSGHNAQPWAVRVASPGRWLVGLDPQRRLPAVDPDDRESLLSLGAFLENLCLAAGALGRKAQVRILEGNQPTELVEITFGKASPSGYDLNKITGRRTVRGGYLNRDLEPAAVEELTRLAGGGLYYFPASSEHGRCMARGALESFAAQSARDAAQAELAQWLRFSNTLAREKRDGLTPASMELGGFAGWYVRNFMDPADALKTDFRQRGVEAVADQVKQGAGWLVLTSPGDTLADRLEAGRRFERLALGLRERSLAAHPMSQQLEEPEFRQRIAKEHGPDLAPQFILRVGYLDSYPAPVSLRRPVGWFVKAG